MTEIFLIELPKFKVSNSVPIFTKNLIIGSSFNSDSRLMVGQQRVHFPNIFRYKD